MTFSNLCALYENACLDYEVSVLTEGADSEEAKTAKIFVHYMKMLV